MNFQVFRNIIAFFLEIVFFFFSYQVNIFDGASNRITFEQVYSKKFKCEYKLDLYPFDTQVKST